MGIRFDLLHPGGDAALAIDSDGRISGLNDSAAELLGCSASDAIGAPCWQIARLTTPRGEPLCAPDCRLWGELERGELRCRRRVLLPAAASPAVAADLISIPGSPSNGSHADLIHLLLPTRIRRPTAGGGPPEGFPRMRLSSSPPGSPVNDPQRGSLGVLSKREREILGLLACGRSTDQIAEQLFISRRTVRNHISSTLKKLQVHRRIDAILAYLQPE